MDTSDQFSILHFKEKVLVEYPSGVINPLLSDIWRKAAAPAANGNPIRISKVSAEKGMLELHLEVNYPPPKGNKRKYLDLDNDGINLVRLICCSQLSRIASVN